MSDVYNNAPDQSYFDWLKRTLGINSNSPSAAPETPIVSIEDLQKSAHAYTSAANRGVEVMRSMQPQDSAAPISDFRAPPTAPQGPLTSQQSLLTKLFPGYNTSNSSAPGTTLQSDYNPVNNPQSIWSDTETPVQKTPEQLKRELDRAYEIGRQKLSGTGASATDPIAVAQQILAAKSMKTPMDNLPYATPGQSSEQVANLGIPAPMPPLQTALASNLGMPSPDAALPSRLNALPAQTDATPMSDYRGAGIQAAAPQIDATPMSDYRGVGIQAPMPVASAPATSIPTAASVAPVDPTKNYINSSVFGLGAKVDPNGINPQTGLTNAQTQMMQYNMLGSVGAKLLAAGQNIMPSQRAQILGELGTAANDPMSMMTQMQQRLLQNNKLSRENAQQTNLAKIMQSPEFQQQFKDMSPQYQALAQAAAASGDINGVMGLIEKSQPQFANGMIINRQAGIATDTVSNQSYDLNTGKPISSSANNGGTSNATPQDYSQYGIPQNVRVNSQYFDGLSDEYKQRLSKVAAGADTLSGASRGNSGMMQRMQMDMYRAFPDYNPLEAQNRASIIKSFAKSDNLKSLYGQSTTLGTFAQHEVGVLDKAEKLGNGPLPAFDAVRNEFLNASGDPRVANFNTELHMLQGEVGKMVRAGVLTDQEQNALNANISSAKSPEQIRGVLDAYHELVNGRINAVDSSTQRVMGDFYDPKKHSLITPETQKMFDKYNSNNWGRPQAAQNSAAPKPGKYKWNQQTGQMEPM